MFLHSGVVGVGTHVLVFSMFSVIPSFAADVRNWGQPVSGLRMSASIVGLEGGAGNIQLALQNTGDKDLAVRIGYRRGDSSNCQVFSYVRFFFKDGEGTIRTVRHVAGAGSGPASQPCTVDLHPGEERAFREPVSRFIIDPAQRLPDILAQRGEFWIDYEPRADSVKAGSGGVPCWLGKVVSNTLVLPTH
jgi:hypothetical protein